MDSLAKKMTAHELSFSVWGTQYSFPEPSYLPYGCLDYKMPVVAYGVMFWENKDLFTGTPSVGFFNIFDPVNGIFGQKIDHLQC